MPSLTEKALQKVGRNIVYFQKIEWMLKIRVIHCKIKGTSGDMAEWIERRKNSISKKTMSGVTTDYFKELFSGHEEEANPPTDQFLSIKMHFELDDQQISSLNRVYEDLVEERNQLIHTRLGEFDPTSEDQCLDLINDLDCQKTKFMPVYRTLRQQLHAIMKVRKELKEFVENDGNWE